MESVALWHERDLSNSSAERLIIPESCILLDYCIDLMAGVIDGMSRLSAANAEKPGVQLRISLLPAWCC